MENHIEEFNKYKAMEISKFDSLLSALKEFETLSINDRTEIIDNKHKKIEDELISIYQEFTSVWNDKRLDCLSGMTWHKLKLEGL